MNNSEVSGLDSSSTLNSDCASVNVLIRQWVPA